MKNNPTAKELLTLGLMRVGNNHAELSRESGVPIATIWRLSRGEVKKVWQHNYEKLERFANG